MIEHASLSEIVGALEGQHEESAIYFGRRTVRAPHSLGGVDCAVRSAVDRSARHGGDESARSQTRGRNGPGVEPRGATWEGNVRMTSAPVGQFELRSVCVDSCFARRKVVLRLDPASPAGHTSRLLAKTPCALQPSPRWLVDAGVDCP